MQTFGDLTKSSKIKELIYNSDKNRRRYGILFEIDLNNS